MIDFEHFDSVAADENTLGGTPRFPGTRVPVYLLIDYLGTGRRIEDFLDQYRLEESAALSFLEELRSALRPHAEAEKGVFSRD